MLVKAARCCGRTERERNVLGVRAEMSYMFESFVTVPATLVPVTASSLSQVSLQQVRTHSTHSLEVKAS